MVPSESMIVAFFEILVGAADMALCIFSSSLISAAIFNGTKVNADKVIIKFLMMYSAYMMFVPGGWTSPPACRIGSMRFVGPVLL